jgi:predicted GH43/DUF377 family glycosyl hydrolase
MPSPIADADADAIMLPDIWTRSPVVLKPDARRTVLRPFSPEYPAGYPTGEGGRSRVIIERLLSLEPDVLSLGVARIAELIANRHRDCAKDLLRRFEEVKAAVPEGAELSEDHKLLIGAYFSEEYSFEAAALFNPSIARHWDQAGVEAGAIRFVMSLRGIGEGHVSSVTFRTGTWSADGEVTIDPPSTYAVSPVIEPMEAEEDEAALFLTFEGAQDLSEAVLFPMAPSQRQGIEDLRLVAFTEDDGTSRYVGTYTAFSGSAIREEILTTHDFTRFKMRPLTGKVADNKGMALFPRKIGGRYAMLGRQDNENIWLMYSDDLYQWDEAEKIVTPLHPWEFVQMGNCGSPLEIDEGWLVITHGVGMVRNYSISACLLDKADPSKVIGRTRLPLLRSDAETRDGYVPNVVYSCGTLIDGRRLLLPYGVADSVTHIVTTTVDQILAYIE